MNLNKGLKVRLALLRYNQRFDKSKTLLQLSRKLFPEIKNPQNKLSGVISGKVKVSKTDVNIICKELKCEPNDLFNEEK